MAPSFTTRVSTMEIDENVLHANSLPERHGECPAKVNPGGTLAKTLCGDSGE
jgi:hypothetical protein